MALIRSKVWRVRGWLDAVGAVLALPAKLSIGLRVPTNAIWTGLAHGVWPMAVGIGLLRCGRGNETEAESPVPAGGLVENSVVVNGWHTWTLEQSQYPYSRVDRSMLRIVLSGTDSGPAVDHHLNLVRWVGQRESGHAVTPCDTG